MEISTISITDDNLTIDGCMHTSNIRNHLNNCQFSVNLLIGSNKDYFIILGSLVVAVKVNTDFTNCAVNKDVLDGFMIEDMHIKHEYKYSHAYIHMYIHKQIHIYFSLLILTNLSLCSYTNKLMSVQLTWKYVYIKQQCISETKFIKKLYFMIYVNTYV